MQLIKQESLEIPASLTPTFNYEPILKSIFILVITNLNC